eukprot:GHVL01004250.1.p2 GENE.GHVL01004250.1~~GHVL01004250.1.p2  ORF type:complete len:104 (+),score=5.58 GHVL01004250.1:238-549(+)
MVPSLDFFPIICEKFVTLSILQRSFSPDFKNLVLPLGVETLATLAGKPRIVCLNPCESVENPRNCSLNSKQKSSKQKSENLVSTRFDLVKRNLIFKTLIISEL